MVEPCLELLRSGDVEGAWRRFIDDYRRLLFSVIRRYARDPDEIMDLFAHLCEQLRADEMRRLRAFRDTAPRQAALSTWLVVVARRLVVDWYRQRDGRIRRAPPRDLTPLGAAIYAQVFVAGRSHDHAWEWARSHIDPSLSHRDFLHELRMVYNAHHRDPAGSAGRAIFDPPEADPAPSAADRVITDETAARLDAALRTLDPDVRAAVLLLVVEEMAAGDIARALGWPNAKAVYNRVYRALAVLRAEFAWQGIDEPTG
jgi:RNA polymerase sigma factor (sigma-70 family)